MQTLKLNFDGIIFDWDGTLMDSSAIIVKNIQDAAISLDLPPSSVIKIRSLIGLTLDQIVADLYPQITLETINDFRDHYYKNVIQNESNELLFEGALEVIAALKARNIKCAIATGKSRISLDRVFKNSNYSALFDATKTGDETRSKPDPLMLDLILEELNIEKSRALMVGDTAYDLAMAQKAGIQSVGVSYGMHSINALNQYNPIAIIDDIRELLPLVFPVSIIK